MRFFETNEIGHWCAERGIALENDARPAPDPRFVHTPWVTYADGQRSGRESTVAAAAVRALGHWDECLLWITLVGVWPSGEDWPTYYGMRGAHGERRSLHVAPGHWFSGDEREELTAYLRVSLENAWDAYVLPAHQGKETGKRLRVSHDEWVEVQSSTPVEFNAPGV